MVTTRPQTLIGLLELIGEIKITPTEFAGLFENPLLIYAVSQAWEDMEALLDNGIVLQGKCIARLRWDLDRGLHRKIAALSEADFKAESVQEAAELDAGDSEYIQLINSATSLGYRRIPQVDLLIEELQKAHRDASAREKAFEELSNKYTKLEEAIDHFGKKKQRYLRKIAGKKMKE